MIRHKVLIIEDSAPFAQILQKYFEKDGFEATIAYDGRSGIKKFLDFKPDIICLDIMLPNMNGYAVAEKIRSYSNAPIIMMSALSQEQDILKGYNYNIDDYLTKPFNPKILTTKAKNILERYQSITDNLSKENIISVGEIEIIRDEYKTFINENEVILSKTEFSLLEYLMLNAGRNCTRELLLKSVWEKTDDDMDERIVDTYIKKLRQNLKQETSYIKTIFGVGYRFEEVKE